MSEEFIEEIDDILSDVLSDVDATSSAEIEQNITFGQSVSAERQTAIVDDRIDQLAAGWMFPRRRSILQNLCAISTVISAETSSEPRSN